MYNFERQFIFSLLPYKIWEKHNGEVVIRADQTTKHTDKLYYIMVTKIAKKIISMRWLVVSSTR